MHCFGITAVVTVIWVLFGYSMAFDSTGMTSSGLNLHSFVGGLNKVMFLNGIGPETMSGSIPEVLFFVFQLTFAIITPWTYCRWRLAERMKVLSRPAFHGFMDNFCLFPDCTYGLGR